jgi:hypothetical protein
MLRSVTDIAAPALIILTLVVVDLDPTVGHFRRVVRAPGLLVRAFLHRRLRTAAPGLDI